MKNFKVRYKERAVIQRAYQRAIQRFGLVDTFAMKDSIRVGAESMMNLNGLYITINAIYYLRFHDSFASQGYSTKNGVNPVPITQEAFTDPKVQEALSTIIENYTQWRLENFPILQNASGLIKDPKIFVGFNFFGDGGKWKESIDYRRLTS